MEIWTCVWTWLETKDKSEKELFAFDVAIRIWWARFLRSLHPRGVYKRCKEIVRVTMATRRAPSFNNAWAHMTDQPDWLKETT